MKLSLTPLKGAEVLRIEGSIADRDAKILRAGLGKILKTGKNKIIVELPPNQDLSTDVIREIADFDGLARELSGRIVLAKVSPALKAKIEAFAKPPVILCFESVEQAHSFLTLKPEVAVKPPVPEAAPGETRESGDLRARVQELERENTRLREQVVLSTLARRIPSDEQGDQERIEVLETKLAQLLEAGAKQG